MYAIRSYYDGTQYRLVVTDNNGCSVTSDPATLSVNEITGITNSSNSPLITNVVLCYGASFSYQVSTSGETPVSYQWKKFVSVGNWENVVDGGVISGATTPTLTFTNGTSAESGEYKVTVTFPFV